MQSKTELKVSTPESSIISGRPGHHDKVIPVPDYTIPQTLSEHDSISRTITRKYMQDNRWEMPSYAGPFYRSPPTPTEIPTKVNPKKIPDSDIDQLGQDINMDFVEIPHIKKV